MISKAELLAALDEAGQAFESCWQSLDTLKYSTAAVDVRGDIIEFQPRLATALYALENFYARLQREKKSLIAEKSTLSKPYLARRLKTIAGYSRAIDRAVDIGKLIGDSFAWLFYQREKTLLRQHAAQQIQRRSAIGVGGKGEIEFIRAFPKINQYFVIYHGTTTFLRLGDVTLVNTQNLTVAGIGELKSHRTSETQLQVMVTMIGDKLPRDVVPTVPTVPTPQPAMRLTPRQQDRFKRQVTRIQKSFKSVPTKTLRNQEIAVQSNFSKLSGLHRKSSSRRFQWVQVSPGLLVAGLKLRKTRFARTVFGGSRINFVTKMRGLEIAARQIVDKNLPNNSLRIGFLPFASRGRYSLLYGMTPVLWWPLTRGVARDLLFGRFLVTTLFNSAFLIKRLREINLNVTVDKDHNIVATMPFKTGNLAIHGLSYYTAAIQKYLIPESAVADIIEKLLPQIDASISTSAIINLDLDFRLD